MTNINLRCECGSVKGVAEKISPKSGLRIKCCCSDCQAFARHLNKDSSVLDEFGATDVYQMPVARVRISTGSERIRAIRLTPDGLFRWYASCCNTPIGNTMAAGEPFIGLIHSFMEDAGQRDRLLGPVFGYIYTKSATRPLPSGLSQPVFFRVIMKFLSNIVIWKIKGLNRPSPFFDMEGNPLSVPRILSSDEKR